MYCIIYYSAWLYKQLSVISTRSRAVVEIRLHRSCDVVRCDIRSYIHVCDMYNIHIYILLCCIRRVCYYRDNIIYKIKTLNNKLMLPLH